MDKSLKAIAEIKFGYYTQPFEKGEVSYLQARQFDDMGNMVSTSDCYINIDEKSTGHLLNDGDVLFVGKGYRNFAWCYNKSFGPAVASSIFFVIKPNQKYILPEYLVAYFNLYKNKLYFQQLGAGSNIMSIRKNELGEFKVPVVSMELQTRVAAIYELHKKDISLTSQLLQHKNELYESVINKLANN